MPMAVVVAGSANNGALRSCSPAAFEALIPIHGRPMVGYVVDALLATPGIAGLVLVGPPGLAEAVPGAPVVPARAGLMENVLAGVEAAGTSDPVLVATGDIPLLTAEAVADFLERCREREADLYYPIIRRAVVEDRYPGARRTYVRLREGSFTGGNLFLVRPAVARKVADVAERLLFYRKRPWRMGGMIGLALPVKYLLGRLSLREAEERVCRMLGVRGAVIVSPYPEIGVDVDRPEDLALVTGILARS
ncbi:MAG: NTP transferase domain-containing protein [Firmicutes bacterium]|nr:NTP transferase domain-containing protein [Bacillota bacterium]